MKFIFTLLFLSIGTIYAQVFTDMEAGLPNFYNSITAFGDVDGDGDLDLYLSGDSDIGETGGLYIYDSETSSYILSITEIPSLSLGSARWGDVDNDGDIDLLLQGYDTPSGLGITDVFINNDGVFTALGLGFPPSYMGEVAFAHVNDDTFLDIAITGMETTGWTNFTTIFTNNGDLTFSELEIALTPVSFGRIKFADYNNDGFQDFVLSGMHDVTYDFYVKIFTNNHDETFTEELEIPLVQNWLGDTEWFDYNADGHIDLIVSGTGGDGMERTTILYKNKGDGVFEDVEVGFPGLSHSSIECADFDNDGDIDVFLTGTETTPGEGNYSYHIYRNDGDNVFTLSETALLNAAYYGDADSGDIDGDGKVDLVISGFDENDTGKSTIYKNTTSIGIDDEFINTFSIYPNPTNTKQITLTSNVNFIDEVVIYSLTGAVVYKESFSKRIDLNEMNSGIYMLQVVSGNKIASKKLIIE